MRLRIVVGMLLVLAVLAGLGIYVAVRSLAAGLPIHPAVQECLATADGTTVSLDPEQMANAATIAAVGIGRGVPDHAVTVALATALQESKLENLEGGDRDSLGLFQQRPSQDWGTPQQIMDPRYAAAQFYKALLKVRGWQDMTVAQAAQKVQRSASGDYYAKWEDEARVLASALTGESPGALGCTITDSPGQHGPAAVSALAHTVDLDWGTGTATSDGTSVAITASNQQSGWQYAHWLVAHADAQDVQRVRYLDQVWTSKSSSWAKATTPSTDRVIAEVYN